MMRTVAHLDRLYRFDSSKNRVCGSRASRASCSPEARADRRDIERRSRAVVAHYPFGVRVEEGERRVAALLSDLRRRTNPSGGAPDSHSGL